MDRFTTEMASLRSEIETLRDGRAAFMKELAAKVSDLRGGVQQMRTDFRNGQKHMASTMKAGSRAFLAELRDTVEELEKKTLGMRREFVADLAGARAAWGGSGASAHARGKKAERSAKQRSRS